MSIDAEHLFTLRLSRDSARAVRIMNGPQGSRGVAPIGEGGTFEGKRLSGTLVTGASGDWPTLRADGSFFVDARLTLLTDDEVPILMTYRGVGSFDPGGDAWMHTSPLFETGDERYSWLNNVQAVAFGSLDGDGVVYEVHALIGQGRP
jgi:hypothetical protein